MAAHEDLLSLHRYCIWANRLRELFYDAIDKRKKGEPPDWADDLGLFMAHWYGAMFVVVEGFRELKLSDPEIDHLLKSPHVELLKRFRNGSFHFQKHYFDARFTDFWAAKDSPAWARQLNLAFGNYFLRVFKQSQER